MQTSKTSTANTEQSDNRPLCIIYARQSADRGDTVSIDGQIEKCKAIANAYGLQWSDNYIFYENESGGKWAFGEELAKSDIAAINRYDASKNINNLYRTEIAKVVQLIRQGEIKNIVVWKHNRIARPLDGLQQYFWTNLFEQHKIRLYDETGITDFVNSGAKLIFNISATINRYEIDSNSSHNSDLRAKLSAEGWINGTISYGYKKGGKKQEIVIDETKRQIVIDIYKKYVNGWHFGKICRYLADNNVPAPKCKSWRTVSLIGILSKPHYIGKRYDENKNIVDSPVYKAIVDDEIWYKAQLKLEQRKQIPFRSKRALTSQNTLFSRKLVCGDCGELLGMIGITKKRKNKKTGKELKPEHRYGATCKNLSCKLNNHQYRREVLIDLWDFIKANRDTYFVQFFKNDCENYKATLHKIDVAQNKLKLENEQLEETKENRKLFKNIKDYIDTINAINDNIALLTGEIKELREVLTSYVPSDDLALINYVIKQIVITKQQVKVIFRHNMKWTINYKVVNNRGKNGLIPLTQDETDNLIKLANDEWRYFAHQFIIDLTSGNQTDTITDSAEPEDTECEMNDNE